MIVVIQIIQFNTEGLSSLRSLPVTLITHRCHTHTILYLSQGDFLGGVDLLGVYSVVNHTKKTLIVSGLCADAHGGEVHERSMRTFRLRAMDNSSGGASLQLNLFIMFVL